MSMRCPTCEGKGIVSEKRWGKLYGQDCNDKFLEEALLALQTHDPSIEVKIINEGGHYDHGEEPAIEIYHHGNRIYHNWGIYLPRLIKEAAEWMNKNYHKNQQKIKEDV